MKPYIPWPRNATTGMHEDPAMRDEVEEHARRVGHTLVRVVNDAGATAEWRLPGPKCIVPSPTLLWAGVRLTLTYPDKG